MWFRLPPSPINFDDNYDSAPCNVVWEVPIADPVDFTYLEPPCPHSREIYGTSRTPGLRLQM